MGENAWDSRTPFPFATSLGWVDAEWRGPRRDPKKFTMGRGKWELRWRRAYFPREAPCDLPARDCEPTRALRRRIPVLADNINKKDSDIIMPNDNHNNTNDTTVKRVLEAMDYDELRLMVTMALLVGFR